MEKVEIYKKDYKKEKIKSRVLLNSISNCLKNIDVKISELEKLKIKQENIINIFDIDCYNYNLVDKLKQSKQDVEYNVNQIMYNLKYIRVNRSLSESISKIKNINETLRNTDIQIKEVEKEDFTDVEKLQMNSIKKAIYDKFVIEKAKIDKEKFTKKYNKVLNRNFILKALDTFFEFEDIVEMKKDDLFLAIHEIDNTVNRINENEKPKKEYKIIEILADIELFLRENYNGRNKKKLKNIFNLRSNIYNVFYINKNELKQELAKKQQSKLPVKISRWTLGIRKEHEKILIFLNQNGYVPQNYNMEFNTNLVNIIGKLNFISDNIIKEAKSNFKDMS